MVLAGCAAPPPASGPDALDEHTVARFAAARALAADADGTLYVADAETSEVVMLTPTGVRLGAFGGPGTTDGALLDVADVDPTNGQAVFVADAGSGAITHFTAERRPVEAIAVPEVDPAQTVREPVGREGPRGRPVAVAAGPDGVLYVAEAERGVVLRLDGRRRVERVLGGPGPGALSRPVGVAVDDDGVLYVADAGRGVVQTFDAFGAAGRAIPGEAVGGPVAVRVSGDRLVVVGRAAVGIFEVAGGLDRVVPVESAEPLVGAVLTRAGLFVLTPTRLARLDPPPVAGPDVE